MIYKDELVLIIIAVIVSCVFHFSYYPTAVRSPLDEAYYFFGVTIPFLFPVGKIIKSGGFKHAPKQ